MGGFYGPRRAENATLVPGRGGDRATARRAGRAAKPEGRVGPRFGRPPRSGDAGGAALRHPDREPGTVAPPNVRRPVGPASVPPDDRCRRGRWRTPVTVSAPARTGFRV